MNYLNKFYNIINVNDFFDDKNNYFAHRDSMSNKFKETIFEHSINTLIVANYFLEKNNFRIISEMSKMFFENSKNLKKEYNISKDFNYDNIFNFFLNTLYITILLHDYGKHNPNFQKEKMDNQIENNNFLINNNIINNDSGHSNYSNIIKHLNKFYIIEEEFIKDRKNFNKDIKEPYFKLLEFLIKKHHSGLDTIDNNELDTINGINDLFNNELNIIFDILYSILVQADMLSTTYYMTIQKEKLNYHNLEDVKCIIENYLKEKLVQIDVNEIKTIEYKKPYNKYLYENIRFFNEKDILNTNNLNDLKYKVASNIIYSGNVNEIFL